MPRTMAGAALQRTADKNGGHTTAMGKSTVQLQGREHAEEISRQGAEQQGLPNAPGGRRPKLGMAAAWPHTKAAVRATQAVPSHKAAKAYTDFQVAAQYCRRRRPHTARHDGGQRAAINRKRSWQENQLQVLASPGLGTIPFTLPCKPTVF